MLDRLNAPTPFALQQHLQAAQEVFQILQSRRPMLDKAPINADLVRNVFLVGLTQLRATLVEHAPAVDVSKAAERAGVPNYRFIDEHDAVITKIDAVLDWITTNFDVNNAFDLDPTRPGGLKQRTYTVAELAPLAALLDEIKPLFL